MAIVLDASVALAWLLPDEGSEAAELLIARAVREPLHAPSLLLVEVASALLQAERRRRLRRSVRLELFDAFTSLPMVLEPIAAESTERALELATSHSLTVYDACYLELALARECAVGDFRLGFESARSLFADLTPARLDLLDTLRRVGPCSVYALAKTAERNDSNVHTDIVRLEELGLVQR